MRTVGPLNGSTVNARDGQIGIVKEVYFDDASWTIRYFVVDADQCLIRRELSILPSALNQPLAIAKVIEVSLTREQVRYSPSVDTHQPVSRQHEQDHLAIAIKPGLPQ